MQHEHIAVVQVAEGGDYFLYVELEGEVKEAIGPSYITVVDVFLAEEGLVRRGNVLQCPPEGDYPS